MLVTAQAYIFLTLKWRQAASLLCDSRRAQHITYQHIVSHIKLLEPPAPTTNTTSRIYANTQIRTLVVKHNRVAWILGTITDFDDVHMARILISSRTLWCNFCRYSTSLNPFFRHYIYYHIWCSMVIRHEQRAEQRRYSY